MNRRARVRPRCGKREAKFLKSSFSPPEISQKFHLALNMKDIPMKKVLPKIPKPKHIFGSCLLFQHHVGKAYRLCLKPAKPYRNPASKLLFILNTRFMACVRRARNAYLSTESYFEWNPYRQIPKRAVSHSMPTKKYCFTR